jgi:hypothetical protein
MSLLGGLLGGGQQPASGADPVGAIVLDVVNELKSAVVRRKKSPISHPVASAPSRLPASVLCSLYCTKHLKALPVSVINSLNASGSKNAAAYQSALGDIKTAVQNALATVQQRASNSAVAGRAQEQVLDAVGNELAKVITNVDTVVDGMAGDVKSQPLVVRLSVLRGTEMPDLGAGRSISQRRRCAARPCPRCRTPASR